MGKRLAANAVPLKNSHSTEANGALVFPSQKYGWIVNGMRPTVM